MQVMIAPDEAKIAATPVSRVKCSSCPSRHGGLCEAIPDHGLPALSSAAYVVELDPDQRFIEEGGAPGDFFIIREGTARVVKMLPDGRQQIIRFASAGDALGPILPSPSGYSAEAVDSVKLCRFSAARLRRLMIDFPGIEHRLLECVCHELELAQEQMLLLGRKSARERLASFLVGWARTAHRFPTLDLMAGVIRMKLPMSRNDIADYLGLRIETVSRMMTELKKSGIIDGNGNSFITIRSFSALQGLDGEATPIPVPNRQSLTQINAA